VLQGRFPENDPPHSPWRCQLSHAHPWSTKGCPTAQSVTSQPPCYFVERMNALIYHAHQYQHPSWPKHLLPIDRDLSGTDTAVQRTIERVTRCYASQPQTILGRGAIINNNGPGIYTHIPPHLNPPTSLGGNNNPPSSIHIHQPY
jgi:hypothetical protein